MKFQKIQWKLYIREQPDPGLFFKIFNTWIPQSPEVFVDVADYKHVEDGPKILLVGHYYDYALDHTDRRYGFLSLQKAHTPPTDLKTSLATFLKAAKRLADDPLLKGGLHFETNELLLILNDRALYPNTQKTFEQLKPTLTDFTKMLYGKAELEREKDPKKRFSVTPRASESPSLETLQKKVSPNV